MRVFNYLPFRRMPLRACLAAALLVSCAHEDRLSENTSIAQMLLGRPARECVDLLGLPRAYAGGPREGRALWADHIPVDIPHRRLGYSSTSTSYNAAADTYTVTTTTTPSYTYYTRDYISHLITLDFLNNKIVGITYNTHNFTIARFGDWRKNNAALLRWNTLNANDDAEAVKKMEQEHPFLATPAMRLKGCLQAAKFDATDLLVYYLRDCKVSPDTKAETWAYGEKCERNPQGDKDSLVLTEATVREIVMAKNSPKVVRKLQELGLL